MVQIKKLRLFAVLLSLGSAAWAVNLGGTEVPKEKFMIFILTGHSNTMFTPGIEKKVNPRFWTYRTKEKYGGVGWIQGVPPLTAGGTRHDLCGPGVYIARKLTEKYPDYHFGIIHTGHKSNPEMSRWHKGNDHGNETYGIVDQVKKDGTIFAWIVMNHFIEAGDKKKAGGYLDGFKKLVKEARGEIGSDLAFLHETPYYNAPYFDREDRNEGLEIIAKQIEQIPKEVDRAQLVEFNAPKGAFTWDEFKMHFDAKRQKEWGEKAAGIIISKNWVKGRSGSSSNLKLITSPVGVGQSTFEFYSPAGKWLGEKHHPNQIRLEKVAPR